MEVKEVLFEQLEYVYIWLERSIPLEYIEYLKGNLLHLSKQSADGIKLKVNLHIITLNTEIINDIVDNLDNIREEIDINFRNKQLEELLLITDQDTEDIKYLKTFIKNGMTQKFLIKNGVTGETTSETCNIPLLMISNIIKIIYMYDLARNLFNGVVTKQMTRGILYLDATRQFNTKFNWKDTNIFRYYPDKPISIYRTVVNDFVFIDLDIDPFEIFNELFKNFKEKILDISFKAYVPREIDTSFIKEIVETISGKDVYDKYNMKGTDINRIILKPSDQSEFKNINILLSEMLTYREFIIKTSTINFNRDKDMKFNLYNYLKFINYIGRVTYMIEYKRKDKEKVFNKMDSVLINDNPLIIKYPIFYKYLQLFNKIFTNHLYKTGYDSYYKEIIDLIVDLNNILLKILPINDPITFEENVSSPYFPCSIITDPSYHNENGFIEKYTEISKGFFEELDRKVGDINALLKSRSDKIKILNLELLSDHEKEIIKRELINFSLMFLSIVVASKYKDGKTYGFTINVNPEKYDTVRNITKDSTKDEIMKLNIKLGTVTFIPIVSGGCYYKIYKLQYNLK